MLKKILKWFIFSSLIISPSSSNLFNIKENNQVATLNYQADKIKIKQNLILNEWKAPDISKETIIFNDQLFIELSAHNFSNEGIEGYQFLVLQEETQVDKTEELKTNYFDLHLDDEQKNLKAVMTFNKKEMLLPKYEDIYINLLLKPEYSETFSFDLIHLHLGLLHKLKTTTRTSPYNPNSRIIENIHELFDIEALQKYYEMYIFFPKEIFGSGNWKIKGLENIGFSIVDENNKPITDWKRFYDFELIKEGNYSPSIRFAVKNETYDEIYFKKLNLGFHINQKDQGKYSHRFSHLIVNPKKRKTKTMISAIDGSNNNHIVNWDEITKRTFTQNDTIEIDFHEEYQFIDKEDPNTWKVEYFFDDPKTNQINFEDITEYREFFVKEIKKVSERKVKIKFNFLKHDQLIKKQFNNVLIRLCIKKANINAYENTDVLLKINYDEVYPEHYEKNDNNIILAATTSTAFFVIVLSTLGIIIYTKRKKVYGNKKRP